VVIDDALPAALYGHLESTFPQCPPGSGPTGLSLFRGDASYESLVRGDPMWGRIDGLATSELFVRSWLSLFAAVMAEGGCVVDAVASPLTGLVESRADKEIPDAPAPPSGLPGASAIPLYVRVDIAEAPIGYHRVRHLDHRRRVIVLLLYCSDPARDVVSGGDLVLHGPSADGHLVVRPRPNRLVAFAASPHSWHSVTPVEAHDRPRRHLQISISARHRVWP
jgi:hypothetical protein